MPVVSTELVDVQPAYGPSACIGKQDRSADDGDLFGDITEYIPDFWARETDECR